MLLCRQSRELSSTNLREDVLHGPNPNTSILSVINASRTGVLSFHQTFSLTCGWQGHRKRKQFFFCPGGRKIWKRFPVTGLHHFSDAWAENLYSHLFLASITNAYLLFPHEVTCVAFRRVLCVAVWDRWKYSREMRWLIGTIAPELILLIWSFKLFPIFLLPGAVKVT